MGLKDSESDQSSPSTQDHHGSFSSDSSGPRIFSVDSGDNIGENINYLENDGDRDHDDDEDDGDQFIEIEIPLDDYDRNGDEELDNDQFPDFLVPGTEFFPFRDTNIRAISIRNYSHRENLSTVRPGLDWEDLFEKNIAGENGRGGFGPEFSKANWELIRSRKSSNTSSMARFVIKIRSIKSMIWSKLNAKTRQHRPIPPRKKGKNETSGMLNLDAFNKLFHAITKNMKHKSEKTTPARGFMFSGNKSPSHDLHVPDIQHHRTNLIYTRDNSVQAAIAHCKRSFEQ